MTFTRSRYLRDSLDILEEHLESKTKAIQTNVTDNEATEKRSQTLYDLVPYLLLKKRFEWKHEDKHEGKEAILEKNGKIDGQNTKKRKRDDAVIEEENDFADTSTPFDTIQYQQSRFTPSINHYRIQLKSLLQENKRLETRRTQLRESHKNFLTAYEYGLHKVSKLNDLTHVPDNIMKGNFPKREV